MICSKCKIDFPVDRFFNDRTQKNGKRSECKECHKLDQRVWRAKYYKYKPKKPSRKPFPLYDVWRDMFKRCYNKNNKDYKHYGARGIYVCERWESLENFSADMGERPPNTSIDRIDNNGPYSPENCRWATPKQQSDNRRVNINIEIDGVTKNIASWARHLGISPSSLHQAKKSKKLSMEEIIKMRMKP